MKIEFLESMERQIGIVSQTDVLVIPIPRQRRWLYDIPDAHDHRIANTPKPKQLYVEPGSGQHEHITPEQLTEMTKKKERQLGFGSNKNKPDPKDDPGTQLPPKGASLSALVGAVKKMRVQNNKLRIMLPDMHKYTARLRKHDPLRAVEVAFGE